MEDAFKPLKKSVWECLVSGHDFSRAEKLFLSTRAGFSPRGICCSDLSSSLFRRALLRATFDCALAPEVKVFITPAAKAGFLYHPKMHR